MSNATISEPLMKARHCAIVTPERALFERGLKRAQIPLCEIRQGATVANREYLGVEVEMPLIPKPIEICDELTFVDLGGSRGDRNQKWFCKERLYIFWAQPQWQGLLRNHPFVEATHALVIVLVLVLAQESPGHTWQLWLLL